MLSAIDKYILVLMGKPQSGWIDIGHTNLNRIDFLYKIVTAKAQMQKITLIPGETTNIFFEDISKKLNLNISKLHKNIELISPYKEAGIYADTYSVPLGIKEKSLINFLVIQSSKKYKKISQKIYGN